MFVCFVCSPTELYTYTPEKSYIYFIMEDNSSSDNDCSNQNEVSDTPFNGLEIQASQVIERLEAGINALSVGEESSKPETRKVSSGYFEPTPTSFDDILSSLEVLVHQSDPSYDSSEPPLLPSDPVTKAAIISHSASALLSRLGRSHAARVGAHIAAETNRWLSHMFRLPDYNAYYHQEQLEGLVRVTRMLLHHKYPRYLEDGALAFSSRMPCIYSSVASPLGVVQHLCRQLSLPLACIRPVPVDPSGRGLDITALEKQCSSDESEGRLPLLVLSEAGAPPLGAGSALGPLTQLCRRKSLHMHLSGHAIALPAVLKGGEAFNIADSLTLTPGQWFGIPGLPTVTFYRIPETATANDISVATNTSSSRFGALSALSGLSGGTGRSVALPLWVALQVAGSRNINLHLQKAFRTARAFYNIIAKTGLKILSEKPGGEDNPSLNLVDSVSSACCCVSFQFACEGHEKPPSYYDKLNSWLGQVLQREADMLPLEVCETESFGVVLRYCPLEGSILCEERLNELLPILSGQLHVLHATVALREVFQQKVAEDARLRLVNVPGWAGLGGVRYVPPGWEDSSPEELNSLNKKLVEKLRATDGAFSCGDADDGLACVRFGMVTVDTDVEELLDLLISAGKDVEDSFRALSDMTEVLKKGIEEAQLELSKRNAPLEWMPVIGRVVSWWTPHHQHGLQMLLTQGQLTKTHHSSEKRVDDSHAPSHTSPPQPQ